MKVKIDLNGNDLHRKGNFWMKIIAVIVLPLFALLLSRLKQF